ncbi:Aste57867_862 [Aphanomyces stellatus]|uniref:Aste57867_862 protein n=1 Tax=Aphanomyces stellatus TaxID=120398 RepID=A0A485K8S0_9STRA|nr:hypothetical protein As57867_000861 [Aphanomyces stellatus]VFT78086.1 Aste57867_862 [Aphanomyces stellatus]
MCDWGAGTQDYVDADEVLPSQMIRDTVDEVDEAAMKDAIAHMYKNEELLDLLDFAKGMFRGTSRGFAPVNDATKLEVQRRNLFEILMKHMMESHQKDTKGHTVLCAQLGDILRREIDTLEVVSLPKLIEQILISIEQAYRDQEEKDTLMPTPIPTVDLLPHLLGRMLIFAHVVLPSDTPSFFDFNEGDDPWTGAHYVDKALGRLIKARWPQRLMIQLCSIFREMDVTPDQHAQLSKKFLAQVEIEMARPPGESQPDYTILPGLFYQLHLFVQNAPKRQKADVMTCWLHYMLALSVEAARLDGASRQFIKAKIGIQEVRACQATMLYHLDKLLIQDDALGPLLLERLQPQPWTSTHVALLLLLRNHVKFQPAVDKLCLDEMAHLERDPTVEMFCDVIASSAQGQLESLVSSAIALGFCFLQRGTTHQVVELGIDIVRHTFHTHAFSRSVVLDRVVDLLLTSHQHQSSSSSSTVLELAHIKLLGTLLEGCLLDFDAALLDRVRDLIEHLPSFPVRVAQPLLMALLYLVKQKMHLRSALVLTMRKAMFKRDASSRIIAICGFCTVLECAMYAQNAKPILLTQRYASAHQASQVMMSQSQSIAQLDSQDVDQGNVTSVFRQFSSLFRRALSCQRSVRQVLYIQLKRMGKQCPDLLPSISELLWPHLQAVVEPNEALSPPVYLKEDDSIPLLLDTLLACDVPQTKSIVERLKNIEMEDFELDKTSVVVDGTPTHGRATDVIQLCDVALNHIWVRGASSIQVCVTRTRSQEVRQPTATTLPLEPRMQSIKLIHVRHKVHLLIQAHAPATKPSTGKKGKTKPSDSVDKKSPMAPSSHGPDDFPMLLIHHRSLEIVLATMVQQIDANLNVPVAFECILDMAMQVMTYWRAQQDLAWLQFKPANILRLSVRMQRQYLKSLVGLLWKATETLFVGHDVEVPPPAASSDPTAAGRGKRRAKDSSGKAARDPESLRCVAYRILDLIFAAAAPQPTMFLAPMLNPDETNMEKLGVQFQKHIFSNLIKEGHLVEAHLLLQVFLQHIVSTYAQEERERVGLWMRAMCQGQEMPFLPLVTRIIHELLQSRARLLEVANAVKFYLTEAQDETDESDTRRFKCLTPKSIAPITTLLLQAFEHNMATVEAYFKGRATTSDASPETMLNDLTSISQCCLPMMTSRYPSQKLTARVIRTMLRLYKLCTSVVQRRLRAKDTTVPSFVAGFLDATSKDLTPKVLEFIGCIHDDIQRQASTKAKATPDAKLIPDLIFQVEQYDVVIIKLSKLCKGVNFNRWCLRRQARDFKLNRDAVLRMLPNVETQSDAPDESQGDAGQPLGGDENDVENGDDYEGEIVVPTDDENDVVDESEDDEDVPATAPRQSSQDEEEDEMSSRHVKRRRLVIHERDEHDDEDD